MKNELKALAWMIPVGVLAFVLVLLVDAQLRLPPEATQYNETTLTAELSDCAGLDVACHMQDVIDTQDVIDHSASVEPVCMTEGGNAYTCAVPTERGPIYLTAPSTCDTSSAWLDVTAQTRSLIQCTSDARAAVMVAAASYGLIPWGQSGLGGRAVWDNRENHF